MSPSADFLAFDRSFRGQLQSTDMEDVDLGALLSLRGDERDLAERMLIELLEQRDDDARVPRALARLGTATAIAAMRKALPTYGANSTRASLALALWNAERHPGAVDALAEILQRSTDWGIRAEALTSLEQIPGEQVDRLIAEAAHNDDRMSRQVAESALLRRFGLYGRRTTPEVRALRDRLEQGDPGALPDLVALARR